MSLHSAQTANHRLESWVYADATARLAATGFTASDVGKIAYQSDTAVYYRLMDDSPITWAQVSVQPYKRYVALLTQTGTNAPTAVVMENSLGGTVVWSRSDVGVYYGTLSGAFTSNKTGARIYQGGPETFFQTLEVASVNAIRLQTWDYRVPDIGELIAIEWADGKLNNTLIDVTVYL